MHLNIYIGSWKLLAASSVTMATYEYLISEIQNQTEQMMYSTAGQNKRSVDDSAAEQTARELEIPKIEGEVQKLLEQVTEFNVMIGYII